MSKSSQIGLGLLVIISTLAYYYFGYHIHRQQFILSVGIYMICFGSFIYFLGIKSNQLFAVGILFRLVLLFSLPNLSQDFYRFIWDGRLLLSGINPYLFTPNDLVNLDFQSEFLPKMGQLSSGNYSNYPPLNQLFFYLSALIGKGNIEIEVLTLKIIIILADIGVYFFGKKILQIASLPLSNIHWYFLNPLVIIELTGNLHFEGVMMFFFALSIYLLISQKVILAGVFWASSILVKLFPLFFVPFVYWYLGKKRFIYFIAVIILIVTLGFVPFLEHSMVLNYYKTVGLWFGKFEFNASIYYLFRKAGFWILGFNINMFYGWFLKAFLLWFIIKIYISKSGTTFLELIEIFTVFFAVYLFTATTIHPWYIVTLVFFSIFLKPTFILVWSFTIFLSYSAYQYPIVKESTLWLLIEYLPVYVLFYYFLKKSRWEGFNWFSRDQNKMNQKR
jgi:hypothetical protein